MYDDPRLALECPLPVSVVPEKDQKFRLLDEIEPELMEKMSSR
jgi:hypothetical protein